VESEHVGKRRQWKLSRMGSVVALEVKFFPNAS